MHVDVVIPTYNRPDLLRRTLRSLQNSIHPVTVVIIIDGNPAHKLDFLADCKYPTIVKRNEKRMDWIASINSWLCDDQRIRNMAAVLYASDDLIFEPACVKNAVETMTVQFPDGDGLVAINQGIKGGCQSAFGLLGRKFINRFPNGTVFCPDYVHWWSDYEIGEYARGIGKFYWCKDAKVKHERPKDETYRLAHKSLHQDHVTHQIRVREKLIWGREFKLVTVGQ